MRINLKLELDSDQLKGVDYIFKNKYVLVGDAPGKGKTAQALAVASAVKGKGLAVVPAGLRKNWYHEVKKFTYLRPLIVKSDADFRKLKDYDFYIISYNYVAKCEDLFNLCDIVICDEVHALKNYKTKRAKAFEDFLYKYKPTYYLPMTGTPIENRVTELYNQLVLLSYCPDQRNGVNVLDYYPTQYRFNSHFCKARKFKVNGRQITNWYGFHKSKKKDLRTVLKGKYYRRTALDLGVELREKDVYIDFKHDKRLQKDWDSFVKNSEMSSTAKADSAYRKTPFTVEYARNLFDEVGGPIVIFTDHLKSYENLMKELGKDFRVSGIVGGMNIEEKDKNNIDFQEGKLDFLVITRAAREGLNLFAASHLIFNDYPWVPGWIDQIIKRIYRKGQTKACLIHNIFGSYQDAKIRKNLEEKIKVLEEIL